MILSLFCGILCPSLKAPGNKWNIFKWFRSWSTKQTEHCGTPLHSRQRATTWVWLKCQNCICIPMLSKTLEDFPCSHSTSTIHVVEWNFSATSFRVHIHRHERKWGPGMWHLCRDRFESITFGMTRSRRPATTNHRWETHRIPLEVDTTCQKHLKTRGKSGQISHFHRSGSAPSCPALSFCLQSDVMRLVWEWCVWKGLHMFAHRLLLARRTLWRRTVVPQLTYCSDGPTSRMSFEKLFDSAGSAFSRDADRLYCALLAELQHGVRR